MLSYNELKIGTLFEVDGTPYEVLSYEFLRMQQRKPVAKTKIKNLKTGQVMERNFHQNENLKEIEVDKVTIISLPGCNTVDKRISFRIKSSSDVGKRAID